VSISDPKAQFRFAVLHHTGVAHVHHDLLIETAHDAPLRAWRVENWPVVGQAIVERLPDHRRVYLEYEGLISGGRGQVKRVDEGTCEIEHDDPVMLIAHVDGRHGKLKLRLRELNGDRWQLEVTASSSVS